MVPAMAWTRADHLTQLDNGSFDVAVIGGGIVGAGAALDLATRGASVAVIEQADFASGTSSKSTKLLHGGIRYLPQFRFGLVREGLLEQRILAETADYLYRPLDFVIPLYRGVSFGDLPAVFGHHRVVPTALRLGLFLYDRMGRRQQGHRRVGADEALTLAPGLRRQGLKGAFVYGDAQTDDARLTIGVMKAAVDRGAVAVNHARVHGVAAHGSSYLLTVQDATGPGSFTLAASTVIAAGGAFAPPQPAAEPPITLRYSRGSHIIIRQADIGLTDTAVVIPETEDERILYMIPWLGHGLVGTTDVESDGDGGHPVASSEEIDYLKRHVARFTGRSPSVLSSFAGTRALAAGQGSSSKASRKERIVEIAPGFFQVAGGKLTGYRLIAAEVADKVASTVGLDQPSTTATVPIAGAGEPHREGPLWRRYGSAGREVQALIDAHPRLGAAFDDGSLGAEVVYAVREEAAATIGDLALRRTHLAWFTPDHGRSAAIDVAQLMGDELGWDESQRAGEIERFEAELALEGL
jgi:glycerol-3-phosphate dehydrogenase